MKHWYQSRLMWLGLSEIVGGAGSYATTGDPKDLILAASGLVTALLRYVTTKAIR